MKSTSFAACGLRRMTINAAAQNASTAIATIRVVYPQSRINDENTRKNAWIANANLTAGP